MDGLCVTEFRDSFKYSNFFSLHTQESSVDFPNNRNPIRML